MLYTLIKTGKTNNLYVEVLRDDLQSTWTISSLRIKGEWQTLYNFV